ncbi:MAG TPA: hypothetical protein VGU01_13635 [Sphingomicrobium sp.]|nr:hypothetical protein [Sphingomicrobium sp.]
MALMSLVEMATKCAVMIEKIEAEKRETLEIAAEMIEAEAKRVIGSYDYEWPQLAEATQDDREKRGFSRNEPGLRTGEMRESIEHTIVSKDEAEIGSNDDNLVYFDLGTKTQPPRPVLEPAAIRKAPEIAAMTGEAVVAVMTSNESRIRKHLPNSS